jgi:hypothetical protein
VLTACNASEFYTTQRHISTHAMTKSHIPQDLNPQLHHHQNLISHRISCSYCDKHFFAEQLHLCANNQHSGDFPSSSSVSMLMSLSRSQKCLFLVHPCHNLLLQMISIYSLIVKASSLKPNSLAHKYSETRLRKFPA